MKPYVTAKNLKEKTKQWLENVDRLNRDHLKIKPDRAALLVIDMQRYFLDPEMGAYTCGGPAVLPNVKKLINAFRKKGCPVIFTRHVHAPDGSDAGIMAWWWEGMCLEGSPESEIEPGLAPLDNEKVISKHRYSAFYNTDLETVLRCQKIEDIVITGVMTNLCCESTARDAYFRDFRVFFPADATGTVIEEMHLASLINLAYGFACITTSDRILKQLR
jgi:ureidoacrylate peracid hydrolase